LDTLEQLDLIQAVEQLEESIERYIGGIYGEDAEIDRSQHLVERIKKVASLLEEMI
jgi:hypothetical protein